MPRLTKEEIEEMRTELEDIVKYGGVYNNPTQDLRSTLDEIEALQRIEKVLAKDRDELRDKVSELTVRLAEAVEVIRPLMQAYSDEVMSNHSCRPGKQDIEYQNARVFLSSLDRREDTGAEKEGEK